MRRAPALLLTLALTSAAPATDPTPLEKQLTVQKAMAAARGYLDVNMPAEAVAALEPEVPHADGNKAFLALLRETYLADLYRLEKEATPDAEKVARVRRNLSLLGGTAPAAKPAPAAPPSASPSPPPPAVPALPEPTPLASFDAPAAVAAADTTADAVAQFKKGNYAGAAKLFAANPAKLTADQKTAWAYCRVKAANDKLNGPGCDPATASALAADVADALKLAPEHAGLQEVGQKVLATATQKASGRHEPAVAAGDAIETASFRVRHSGNRELADAVGKAAEQARKQVFERWSGPPAGAWEPKCEVVIHATAEAFAKATGRPAGSTGTATVRLSNGRATERRIDLRADDPAAAANALPRELTHVVLADLFPDKPPPKWAEEGMAVLAGSPEESARFLRTLPRCARDGDWFALALLLEMKDFPADKVTGFYCQSVSLTDYLVRLGGGERNFTIFLRDCQRYGTPQALKRQYNLDGPQALEAAWKRTALETGRAQGP